MWWLVAYANQGIVKLSVFACRSKFGNTVDQKAASIFYSTDSSRRDNCCFFSLKSDFLPSTMNTASPSRIVNVSLWSE